MLILKRRCYSNFSNKDMVEKLVERLEKNNIDDFEVVSQVPKDVISISGNISALKIYIPTALEFTQYDIDDFIRSIKPHFRTSTMLDRDIYVMRLSGSLNIDQCYKLVKFIIEVEDFCAIVE